MRYVKIFIAAVILSFPVECFSQNSILPLGFWNLTALSGELKIGGLLAAGDVNTYGINNKFTTHNYYGGIMVNTSSYIWNPNFLTVDIDGGYYPESRQDLYLVSPNIYNVINAEKLHFRTTFFPKKAISLSTFLNFDDTYDSRENLTDIKTNSKTYGSSFSYRNKFLPITMSYNVNDWGSKEMLSGRTFNYLQKTFDSRVTKTFGRRDKNELLYTHYDYDRRDYSLAAIHNISDNLQLLDGFYFDSAQRSYFNSNIMGTIQKGNDSFKQFRANENFNYRLPHNLTFNTSYGFYYIQRQPQELGQHSYNAMLSHQLFESLHSAVSYEYNNAIESSYHDVTNKTGFDINYMKKTFANGLLNIIYTYNRVFERRSSTDVLLNVLNEEYTISDRIILKRPYVNQSSVVIKDATGTTIYQEGLDYFLTTVGSFVEVQRVPGGLIQQNGKIYVFYSATQPGSFQYDINQQNFMINYSIFNRLLDFYYKTNRTDFVNVHNADNLLLDFLTDDIYGSSVKYKSATAGVEYDNFQSSLVPYKMIRYYVLWQGRCRNRFNFSLNANWRDYKIPAEVQHRIYKDVNGMMSYDISRMSKIDINVGYQSQEGRQINLDLFSARTKYTTIYRRLTFAVGLDAYEREYLNSQKTSYLGAYIQVVKKFKY